MRCLARNLHNRHLTLKVQARLRDEFSSESVILPGFNLFDHAAGFKVIDWCVTRPPLDRDDVIGIYEEYIDRPLGKVPAPDRVARQVYPGSRGADVFGFARKPQEWWMPLIQLISIASLLSGVSAEYDDDLTGVRLELGDYTLSATPTSYYSNMLGRMVEAGRPATDASIESLQIPLLVTTHPLARALKELSVPPSWLWAANTAIRAQAAGRLEISPERLSRPKRVPKHWTKKVRAFSISEVSGAMAQCRDILEDPYEGSALDLYIAAVPRLMKPSDFTSLVPDPRNYPDKVLSENQVGRFEAYLDAREKELSCNPAATL